MSVEPDSPLEVFQDASDLARDWPFTDMTWPEWFLFWLRPSTWRRLLSHEPSH